MEMTVKISGKCQGVLVKDGEKVEAATVSLATGQTVGYIGVCHDGTTHVTVRGNTYKVPSEYIQYE